MSSANSRLFQPQPMQEDFVDDSHLASFEKRSEAFHPKRFARIGAVATRAVRVFTESRLDRAISDPEHLDERSLKLRGIAATAFVGLATTATLLVSARIGDRTEDRLEKITDQRNECIAEIEATPELPAEVEQSRLTECADIGTP